MVQPRNGKAAYSAFNLDSCPGNIGELATTNRTTTGHAGARTRLQPFLLPASPIAPLTGRPGVDRIYILPQDVTENSAPADHPVLDEVAQLDAVLHAELPVGVE